MLQEIASVVCLTAIDSLFRCCCCTATVFGCRIKPSSFPSDDHLLGNAASSPAVCQILVLYNIARSSALVSRCFGNQPSHHLASCDVSALAIARKTASRYCRLSSSASHDATFAASDPQPLLCHSSLTASVALVVHWGGRRHAYFYLFYLLLKKMKIKRNREKKETSE